ncbi:MAG: hypothetical protein PGN08_00825 [Sphingomonas taxi]
MASRTRGRVKPRRLTIGRKRALTARPLWSRRPCSPIRASSAAAGAALLWAGGILWFAYDVAGSGSGTADGNAVATDATGAVANADDLKALANVIAD